uniref:Uncharacterized protein n=1 Tax=Anguilla anguilla TaxID=7936 RepID=A0A0E9QFV4_ANGAN
MVVSKIFLSTHCRLVDTHAFPRILFFASLHVSGNIFRKR